MTEARRPLDDLVWFLKERAKELNCLYQVEELLGRPEADLADVCRGILAAIPPGWQYPEVCRARIELLGAIHASPDFEESEWVQSAEITVQDQAIGTISVYYSRPMPPADDGPFLKEESRLLRTIADRLGHFVTHQRMRQMYQELQQAGDRLAGDRTGEWRVLLNLLRQTDQNLFVSISHKLLNHLCWHGIPEAGALLRRYHPGLVSPETAQFGLNRPLSREADGDSPQDLAEETFRIATEHLSDESILAFIQQRIQEDKLSFLGRALSRQMSLPAVADAVRRFRRMAPEGTELPSPMQRSVRTALARRLLSEELAQVDLAHRYISVRDFHELLQTVIFTPESYGRLGGKSAGLILAAHILKASGHTSELLASVRTPKSWYLTSDCILAFMHFNNLEEIVQQKYKDIEEIRLEYPHIVQSFKNAHFPMEILRSLSVALDDFGDSPLIVRSSSLLEDRVGAAFSGKYKSLFLANQGNKSERLVALCDAIAEVYASTFGPDPLEYRAERGLLDFNEEMGILIQEVVGSAVGDYFMPAYAGVAFSRNELRWSPRIRREDGLIRLVAGLGTRAVDRTSDDYPILVAPGQPGLRVNATVDEAIRYSPRRMDVIHLVSNSFQTVDIEALVRARADEMPWLHQIISVRDGDRLRGTSRAGLDLVEEKIVVTFDRLITETSFMQQVRAILTTLETAFGTPVDIEFASDGKEFYLLQCRAQSSAADTSPAIVPREVAPERLLFSAHRYVSNGRVGDITHLVYVDPLRYRDLPDEATMLSVGRAIGRLNNLLPKRQFVLMGPGRWGSRGDIRLGISVTYSDINNSSCLIEIARQQGSYVPDLSFGTHFFQDLVEAGIRYLPLYPDDARTVFNERFLLESPNIFPQMLPEFAHLADTVHLVDIPGVTGGLLLHILMNGELDEAVGLLAAPRYAAAPATESRRPEEAPSEEPWRWRLTVAEHVAAQLDPDRFGVKGLYIFGSTKNATAGPASDIDLLVHFTGSDAQRRELEVWLEGWSLCLDEMNYLRTGYRTGGLLDAHIVTDADIAARTSFSTKIGAVTDAARPLPLAKGGAEQP